MTNGSPPKETTTFDALSFQDSMKLLESFKLPGIDLSTIIESQRKDMEALNEANQEAFNGIKALAERRREILQEVMTQWQEAMKDTTSREASLNRSELLREGVQQAVANFRELADIEAQSRARSWKILQDRFQENVGNLQKLLQPK
jgi:phasin family protein